MEDGDDPGLASASVSTVSQGRANNSSMPVSSGTE